MKMFRQLILIAIACILAGCPRREPTLDEAIDTEVSTNMPLRPLATARLGERATLGERASRPFGHGPWTASATGGTPVVPVGRP